MVSISTAITILKRLFLIFCIKRINSVHSALIIFLTLLVLCSTAVFSTTLSKLYIGSGTRAPFGLYQTLSIETDGKLHIFQEEMNQPSTQKTLDITLTSDQMQSIFDKAVEVGLFDLDSKYDSGALDGSGVSITIQDTDGIQKTIEVYNYKQDAVSEFIKKVNEYLPSSPVNFKIDYLYLD